MCGIVGFTKVDINNADDYKYNCMDILINGLRKLEYRGYDSAGIATFTGSKLTTVKAKGRLQQLEDKLSLLPQINADCGIGHTRWATHGEPSDVNSHPHGDEKISIVHNGIIENYMHLKEFLQGKGYDFQTQTDTETIVKLLDYYYNCDGDPEQAIKNTVSRLKGSYALGIIFSDHPNKIYALRKDSPLIIGVSEIGYFICSDIPAILDYTNQYYLLEEQELAVLSAQGVSITNFDNEFVSKELLTALWDCTSAQKGGYPHFMLKEIHEVPDSIKKTLSPRVVEGMPELGIDELTDERLNSFNKIHIVACGTAMHAGLIGKHAIEQLARKPVSVEVASEFRYNNPILSCHDLVIIISQSGETADTVAALRLAKQHGAYVLAIVNVVGSSIAREADSVMYTYAGLEIAVASTKAYTVQTCTLYLLALRLGYASNNYTKEQVKSLTSQLLDMTYITKGIIDSQSEQCKYIASLLQNSKDLFYLGRGLDYCLAMEGSLKLKEISYIHSESYPAGELKHGTISLVTDGMPIIAIATQQKLISKMVSNIKEVSARGGNVLLICNSDIPHADDFTQNIISLQLPSNIDDLFMAVPTSIIVQLIAYYTSVLRGCDVDKPRNLAKSVTVE